MSNLAVMMAAQNEDPKALDREMRVSALAKRLYESDKMFTPQPPWHYVEASYLTIANRFITAHEFLSESRITTVSGD